MRSRILFAAVWLAATITGATAASRVGTVEVWKGAAVQAGRVAYIDSAQKKIIEITPDGEKTWEFSIPAEVIGSGDLSLAPDIEWSPATDHFLFVVPRYGVFEVDRAKQIVWSYKTKYVTHDADRLPNGNTIFVNGADEENDPTVTEVDKDGKVVFQWFARDHVNARERWNNPTEKLYTFTHANAVQRLANGSTLVSLRNFFRFVIIKDGQIVRQGPTAPRIHDPVITPTVTYFAIHGRDMQALVRISRDGLHGPLFTDATDKWKPLRTVEILRNGNILITGSRYIGQIDPGGNLVWSIKLTGFVNEEDRRGHGRDFSSLYKAAWVYKP